MKKYLLFLLILLQLSLYAQQIHVLKKNETLYRLGQMYSVSVDEIIRINHIDDPSELAVGTRLVIPGQYANYEVKKGDNLYRIARIYNLKPDTLASMNGMNISDTLYVGQVLKVPQEYESDTPAGDSQIAEKKNFPRFFWPHNGERVQMNGKLIGTQIQGNKGDPVVSVSTGKVIWVEPYRGFGKLIIVESDDGIHYVYGGNEENLVQVGQMVSPGTKLGILGQSTAQGSARVFFSVYKNGIPMDTEKAPRK